MHRSDEAEERGTGIIGRRREGKLGVGSKQYAVSRKKHTLSVRWRESRMTDNTSLFTAEMQRRRGKRRDLGTERLRDERLND